MTVSFLVPWPNGVQLEFVYSMGTIVFENRLWMLVRDPPNTQARLDALVASAAAYWIANMLPLQGSDVTLQLVRATTWDNPLSPLSSFVLPVLPGGFSGQTHSANVAIRVSFDGPSDIAIYRNGNFFGGIPADAVAGNIVDPFYADDLFEAYAAIIDAAGVWGLDHGWRWSVASLVSSGALRSEIFARRVVLVRVVTPYVTQRRKRIH